MNNNTNCRTCSNFCHPNYLSLATRGCDSVLIDDKIIKTFVMIFNELSFVCLDAVVVASDLLQLALHCRHYSSLPSVSLHSASFQFRSFSVWWRSCCICQDCPAAPLGSLQILQCTKRVPVTRNEAFFDLNTPLLPPKKRLIDYFQAAV